jgi:hypothetical protein
MRYDAKHELQDECWHNALISIEREPWDKIWDGVSNSTFDASFFADNVCVQLMEEFER